MFRESLSFLQSDTAGPLLLLEAGIWAVMLALAFFLARRRKLLAFGSWSRAANRRSQAVVATGILALMLRLALLPFIPVPAPAIHDEFSYLLASDTFAHGRLTNPPHPLATHFESVHVNVRPTYQSMYPPAQGLAMALGQVLFHSPWLGVLLSVAALAMAVTWMLQGWMPPRWALLGGVFCALRFATFSYTVNTYMGGAVAGIGGALVLGAAGRMRRRFDARTSLLLAVGLGMLANARPYEGMMVALPAMAFVLWRARETGWSSLRALAPGVALLVLVGAWMLYYNWRGTGHPLLMPYQANWEQYHITRPFIWQKARAIPHYTHDSLRWVYVMWEYPVYLQTRTAAGLLDWTEQKLTLYYRFYVFPLLPLFVLGWRYALRRQKLLGITLAWFTAGLLIMAWRPQPHYASPAIALLIAVLIYGLRIVRTWRVRDMRIGLPLARLVVIVVFGLITFQIAESVSHAKDPAFQYKVAMERPQMLRRFEQMGGKHVILIHYVVGHEPSQEWVYNGADIDAQQVIWARDMGAAANEELRKYYADRKIWVINPD